MNKLHLTLRVSIVLFSITYSQSITNYEVKTASFRFKNEKGTWKDWSKQIKVNLSFKIDLQNRLIYLYNDEPEKFKIIGKEDDKSDKGDIILWCLNSEKKKFIFRIRPIKDEKLLFLIQHKTFEFIYNVSYLGE